MKKPHPRNHLRRLSIPVLGLVLTHSLLDAQSTWLNVRPLRNPPIRTDHAMAYDSDRGVVVLFGGRGRTIFNDTWEWDGYLWNQKTPTTRPSARYGTAMAYDAKRKRIVLFGGSSLADTWEWDGAVWTRKSPTNNPARRSYHAMAYDSHREVIVMFGGQSTLADTWEWNGVTWTERKPTTIPGGRYQHGMAYDAARRKTLMVGGVGSSVRRRIWQWDGTTWTPRSPSLEPNPSYRHGVAYDSARARVMSFGGYRNPGSNRLFEWDGGEWTEVFPRRSPPPRYAHAMAYDSRRRRLVVFGGWLDNGYYSNDTWELVHDCIVVGQGHPGGGIPITCVTSPIIGSNFQIAYAASRGSGILFLGSAPVGSPFLQATPPLVCRSGTLHPTPLVVIPGTGSPVLMNFVIPLNPQLIGSRITLQAVAPQITNCFLLTDAIEIAIRK